MPVEKEHSGTSTSYLLFSLGGEIFGAELLKVLEVMKLPSIKSVPYMKPAFKGVLNLRGQIISVVDMRTHLEVGTASDSNGMVLIIETANVPIGAVVDELLSVEMIAESEIDRLPVIETKVPSEHLLGVAKLNERLITLLNISGCLTTADFRTIRQREKVA